MSLNFVSEVTQDYLIFTYVLSLSALQIAAGATKLRGLLIVPGPTGTALALLSVTADIGWFFSVADRNIAGLAGWEQFILFVLSASAALLTSLVLASLFWRPKLPVPPDEDDGIDALRYVSYWDAMASRWLR